MFGRMPSTPRILIMHWGEQDDVKSCRYFIFMLGKYRDTYHLNIAAPGTTRSPECGMCPSYAVLGL
jgi:hypothetical protein